MIPKLAVLLSLAGVVSAQPQAHSDWGNLKALAAGDDVRVAAQSRPRFRARFARVTDETLVVATAGTEESLARTSVVSVAVKRASHRKRNALIGLGVGAGAGLATGAALDSKTCQNRSNCIAFFGPNIGKEVLTPVGAIVGVAVGALIPTGGWRDIYRSR